MKPAKRNQIKRLIVSIAELARLNIPEGSVLSVNFPGPRTMRRLNKTHLGHDYLTDAICFNYSDGEEEITEGDVAIEIFISPDIAMNRSEEDQRMDYSSEMVLYLVHAILHASGMSDQTTSGKKQMRRKETAIISIIKEEFDFEEIFPS